ncbi:hypothetical protein L596_007013 [Steinernema carpocapsae]|uniref:Serine-threonine/tyrosine-protein kinase catalytic domain-containing protein n=1 Tax=Steinernema carpocapsae TaxID=34508 RepID=A0A4U5P7Y3_STECR|nr:hypothetical protein L596_007013 [Steinernema carpocapsae]
MLTEDGESGTADFLREAKAMYVLSHPRVLEFVGVYFDKENRGRPTILFTKFMPYGNLAQFLRDESRVTCLFGFRMVLLRASLWHKF